MKGLRSLILAGAALWAVPGLSPIAAHCPGQVPEVRMSYPSEGVAIQEACYDGFSSCLVDTFHSAKLQQELTDEFKNRKYAVFAYVDGVRNYETYDSVFYKGELYYIDTMTTEDVQVSFHTFLKDTLPVRKVTLIDRWIAFTGNPLATTYLPLIDTPFVAFFDTYDTLANLGIGPMDGCFFEPTAFIIKSGRIHKKGGGGVRMPGVSVGMDEFFAAVGMTPVPVPPVGIFRPAGKALRYRQLPGSRRFDVLGRPIEGRLSPIPVFSVWDTRPGRNLRESGPTDGIGRP